MPYVDRGPHGGECCGIRHLFSFGNTASVRHQERVLGDVDRYVEQHGAFIDDGIKMGKLFEVVLTDYQIRNMPILARGLKQRGFRLVSRFHNSSGTWCNVLHHTPANNTGGSPFRSIPDA